MNHITRQNRMWKSKTHIKRFNYKKKHTMKCQALSKHTRQTLVVTDMLSQRFTIYHPRRWCLAFTSLHSIGSDLCPSSQALIHVVKTLAPPLQSYALIGHPARPRRACSQCARGGSGALGGSSVRSGNASSVQRREPRESIPCDSSEGRERERKIEPAP